MWRAFRKSAHDCTRLELLKHFESMSSLAPTDVRMMWVRLVDSFQEGSWFLMVLELVGGGDLFTAF